MFNKILTTFAGHNRPAVAFVSPRPLEKSMSFFRISHQAPSAR